MLDDLSTIWTREDARSARREIVAVEGPEISTQELICLQYSGPHRIAWRIFERFQVQDYDAIANNFGIQSKPYLQSATLYSEVKSCLRKLRRKGRSQQKNDETKEGSAAGT